MRPTRRERRENHPTCYLRYLANNQRPLPLRPEGHDASNARGDTPCCQPRAPEGRGNYTCTDLHCKDRPPLTPSLPPLSDPRWVTAKSALSTHYLLSARSRPGQRLAGGPSEPRTMALIDRVLSSSKANLHLQCVLLRALDCPGTFWCRSNRLSPDSHLPPESRRCLTVCVNFFDSPRLPRHCHACVAATSTNNTTTVLLSCCTT